MISRTIEKQIASRIGKGKAILLFGPRQAGKTTLLKQLAKTIPYTWLNGDEADVKFLFESPTSTALKNQIGDRKLLIIDEAQTIPNIGIGIKLLVDNYPELTVIASGSSSFELANQLQEPLTGRKFEFWLYPLSFEELSTHFTQVQEQRSLAHRLVFGSYPEVVQHPGEEQEYLQLITSSYLYKDIFQLSGVKKPLILQKIVQALAFQIGNEVSFHELGKLVGADNQTVERYVDVLEKAFVVFQLNALSRNHRNEIKKSKKIYFYDLGIRNVVINNFNPIERRQDVGHMWENYLVAERIKHCRYHKVFANHWFWRTTTQVEIDYIEERDGQFFAFEFKLSLGKQVKVPQYFTETYPNHSFELIDKSNYADFLLPAS